MALWIPLGLFLFAGSVWGWRLVFRAWIKDFGADWETIPQAAIVASVVFWAWPAFAVGIGVRRIVRGRDAEMFARRLGGRSHAEKIRDREREIRDRKRRIACMERELGLTPLPDTERRG